MCGKGRQLTPLHVSGLKAIYHKCDKNKFLFWLILQKMVSFASFRSFHPLLPSWVTTVNTIYARRKSSPSLLCPPHSPPFLLLHLLLITTFRFNRLPPPRLWRSPDINWRRQRREVEVGSRMSPTRKRVAPPASMRPMSSPLRQGMWRTTEGHPIIHL